IAIEILELLDPQKLALEAVKPLNYRIRADHRIGHRVDHLLRDLIVEMARLLGGPVAPVAIDGGFVLDEDVENKGEPPAFFLQPARERFSRRFALGTFRTVEVFEGLFAAQRARTGRTGKLHLVALQAELLGEQSHPRRASGEAQIGEELFLFLGKHVRLMLRNEQKVVPVVRERRRRGERGHLRLRQLQELEVKEYELAIDLQIAGFYLLQESAALRIGGGLRESETGKVIR